MMRKIATLLLCSSVMILPARTSNGKARAASIAGLRDHLSTAMAHAQLNDKDRKKLEASRQVLQKTIETRRSGGKLDQKKFQKTLDDIAKQIRNNAFQPEDRQAVEDCLKGLRRPQAARSRSPHPMRHRGLRTTMFCQLSGGSER